MERLTKRIDLGNGKHTVDFSNERCGEFLTNHKAGVRALFERLADYEDAEEQGLLIRLPCKVGDTIYKLWYKPCHHGEDHPDSYGCCGCEDDCDLEKAIFEFVVPSMRWVLDHLESFDEFVWFLTREEAEKALAKMEEK